MHNCHLVFAWSVPCIPPSSLYPPALNPTPSCSNGVAETRKSSIWWIRPTRDSRFSWRYHRHWATATSTSPPTPHQSLKTCRKATSVSTSLFLWSTPHKTSTETAFLFQSATCSSVEAFLPRPQIHRLRPRMTTSPGPTVMPPRRPSGTAQKIGFKSTHKRAH